mmetsp:Transcript_61834/g.186565  ORF Transcript_61834/g.186565 Transcript_61834/m.186565 type:complete len:238 (-) Transcript_61834:6-719(-)
MVVAPENTEASANAPAAGGLRGCPGTLKLASSTLYEEDVHFGTHLEVWGSWYDVEQKAWGYACCRSLRRKRRRCPTTAPPGSSVQDEDDEELEVRVSRRLAELLEQCPGFSGDVPTPDQEKDWSLTELRNYVLSNGLIRPARRRGEQRAPPTAADWKALEIEEGADVATVRKAYKRLALLHHPDKHHGAKQKARATEAFRRVAAAYEAVCGHAAEVPALAAASDASRTRRWRLVVVD